MKVIGIIIFIIAMILYVRFVLRKSERDWVYMQESNRKHNEWMIQCGRDQKAWEQIKNKRLR